MSFASIAACARRQPVHLDAPPAGEVPSFEKPSSSSDTGALDASESVMVPVPVPDGAPTNKPVLLALPAVPAKTFPPPDGAAGLVGCGGFFPAAADSDDGQVFAIVTVEPSGAASSVSIVEITPASEKLFGEAARSCLLRASFRPAVGPDGQPQRGRVAVKVRFMR